MRFGDSVVVSGVGVEIPGAPPYDLSALLDGRRRTCQPDAFEPAAVLGRKGLRYRDRSTLLGMCASKRALDDALWVQQAAEGVDLRRCGVVVSSNLGNLDTVCRVSDTVSVYSVDETSPMDLPNASSNIVASSIAIRWQLQGVNLTLCNGSSSGLDAVAWAANLLTSSRADMVLVVGVEPHNEVTACLTSGDPARDVAAALVLETRRHAEARGVQPAALLTGTGRGASLSKVAQYLLPAAPGLWLTSDECEPDTRLAGARLHRLDQQVGHASGALGVLETVVATETIKRGQVTSALASARCDGHGAVSAVSLAASSLPAVHAA